MADDELLDALAEMMCPGTHCGDLGFIPHEPETWPWRLAKTKRRLSIIGGPVIPAGATVKVVMASRFGDLGITRKLKAEHGYEGRVSPDDLEPIAP